MSIIYNSAEGSYQKLTYEGEWIPFGCEYEWFEKLAEPWMGSDMYLPNIPTTLDSENPYLYPWALDKFRDVLRYLSGKFPFSSLWEELDRSTDSESKRDEDSPLVRIERLGLRLEVKQSYALSLSYEDGRMFGPSYEPFRLKAGIIFYILSHPSWEQNRVLVRLETVKEEEEEEYGLLRVKEEVRADHCIFTSFWELHQWIYESLHLHYEVASVYLDVTLKAHRPSIVIDWIPRLEEETFDLS